MKYKKITKTKNPYRILPKRTNIKILTKQQKKPKQNCTICVGKIMKLVSLFFCSGIIFQRLVYELIWWSLGRDFASSVFYKQKSQSNFDSFESH